MKKLNISKLEEALNHLVMIDYHHEKLRSLNKHFGLGITRSVRRDIELMRKRIREAKSLDI